MNKYTRHDPEFHIQQGILGFQQVQSNPDKVFIWMRDTVDRSKSQNRHKTTRMANDSDRKPEWVKSVWLKSKVWQHLRKQLESLNIKYQDLLDLNSDELSDKWVTNGDGDRNFLKAIIPNAVSEVTGEEFKGQVTQYAGKAPESIYRRAKEESDLNLGEYEVLLNKYKNRACIKTYAKTYVEIDGKVIPSRELRKVFVREGIDKLPVYEETEVTLGEPHHIFIDYEIPNELPVDTIPEDTMPLRKMSLLDIINEDREKIGKLDLQVHEKNK